MDNIQEPDRRIKVCAKKHGVKPPIWVKNSDMHPMQNIAGRWFRGLTKGGERVFGIYGQPWSRLHEIEGKTLEWRFEQDA